MTASAIADRLDSVREKIAKACADCGRSAASVRLVAVSKRIPDELLLEACRAGQWDLGENRVQDALDRQERLPGLLAAQGLDPTHLRWHFIGHLQRNKAGKAGGNFHLLHGVDSLPLARRLSDLAVAREAREAVLLQVNISAEDQKHGFLAESAVDAIAEAAALPGLEVRGLMGMSRFGADVAGVGRTFATLRRVAEKARTQTHLALPELSMGMSGDFEVAISEGSTLLRVGTAIFGPRPG